jgi:hypothetical protein
VLIFIALKVLYALEQGLYPSMKSKFKTQFTASHEQSLRYEKLLSRAQPLDPCRKRQAEEQSRDANGPLI